MPAEDEHGLGRLVGVFVEDDQTPGTWNKVTLINRDKSIEESLNTTTASSADPADPTKTVEERQHAVSFAPVQISGGGAFTINSYKSAHDIFKAAKKRNFRLTRVDPSNKDSILSYREGTGLITQLGEEHPDGDEASASITIVIDGGLSFNVGAPA